MFSINTNTSAMAALQSLTATNVALTQAQSEVSTGKKVNSASDDPALFAVSQTMNAQIAGLSGVSDGLQVAAQAVGTALTQSTSTGKLLATLSQALTEDQGNTLNLSTTITSTLAQIDANANGANFNGINLLSGAIGGAVTATSVSAATNLNASQFAQSGFNITSAGLGLAGLTATGMTGVDVAFGSTAPILDGAGTAALGDNLTLSTNTVDTATGTAQDPANTVTFAMNDGTAANVATAFQTSIAANLKSALGAAAAGAITVNNDGTLNSLTGYTSSSTDSSGNTTYTFTNASTGATAALKVGTDQNGNTVYTAASATDANGNTTSAGVYVSVNMTAGSTSGAKISWRLSRTKALEPKWIPQPAIFKSPVGTSTLVRAMEQLCGAQAPLTQQIAPRSPRT